MMREPPSTTDQIRDLFNLANLRHEAARNLKGDAHIAYLKNTARFDALRKTEIETYEKDYLARVEVERKKLIDKSGEKNKNFQHPWFGSDRFNSTAITRQAQNIVRHDHDCTLLALDSQEATIVASIIEKARDTQSFEVNPGREFEKSADRRSGQERRKPREY